MDQTSRLNDAVEMVDRPMLRPNGSCSHIMALHFDPQDASDRGVIRCIDEREGHVHVPGYVDRSYLRAVDLDSLYTGKIGRELEIEDSATVVSGLDEFGPHEFLGFEDPVIWRSSRMDRFHLYCTIPFYDAEVETAVMYLGHASGEDIYSLRMHEPVLGPERGRHDGAKEPVIAPPCSGGYRYNLVESTDTVDGTGYSVVRTAIARGPGGPWEYDDLVLHPAHDGREWCARHVSPGPLLPQSFVDVGDGKLVGLLNGREDDQHRDGRVHYGRFAIGLVIYDYEDGAIEWISDEPFIDDPAARTITFASAFRRIEAGRGAIYAHVDDSFVRVYRVDATALSAYLP